MRQNNIKPWTARGDRSLWGEGGLNMGIVDEDADDTDDRAGVG